MSARDRQDVHGAERRVLGRSIFGAAVGTGTATFGICDHQRCSIGADRERARPPAGGDVTDDARLTRVVIVVIVTAAPSAFVIGVVQRDDGDGVDAGFRYVEPRLI